MLVPPLKAHQTIIRNPVIGLQVTLEKHTINKVRKFVSIPA